MRDDVRQGLSDAIDGAAIGVATIAMALLLLWWMLPWRIRGWRQHAKLLIKYSTIDLLCLFPLTPMTFSTSGIRHAITIRHRD
jgi:hypothetical protein